MILVTKFGADFPLFYGNPKDLLLIFRLQFVAIGMYYMVKSWKLRKYDKSEMHIIQPSKELEVKGRGRAIIVS